MRGDERHNILADLALFNFNGKYIVCKGASNKADCPKGDYTMTINNVPQNYVTIDGALIAATTSNGTGNSCHSCQPISASFQSFVVIN